MSMTRKQLVVRGGAAALWVDGGSGVRRRADGRVRHAAPVRPRRVRQAGALGRRGARRSELRRRPRGRRARRAAARRAPTCAGSACCSSRTSSSSSRARRSTPTRGSSSRPRTPSGGSVPRSVVVAEGPGHRRDTEAIASRPACARRSTTPASAFVDLNDAPLVRTPLETRYTGLRELWVPRVLRETEVVVSMPKLKTHHWVGVTLSLKNCFGCMPGRVYGWPKNVFHVRGIPESILDIVGRGASVARDRRRHRRHGGRRADHGRPGPRRASSSSRATSSPRTSPARA